MVWPKIDEDKLAMAEVWDLPNELLTLWNSDEGGFLEIKKKNVM